MNEKLPNWAERAQAFLLNISSNRGAPSKPNGKITLYGTAYAWMASFYLGQNLNVLERPFFDMLKETRDKETGLFYGPELKNFIASKRVVHDLHHLQLHMMCSAILPVAQQLDFRLPGIHFARNFLDIDFLKDWQRSINWKQAWLEGNNILFVGQLLVYMRDIEKAPEAQKALDCWFDWLDTNIDPATGLWGTNGHCSPMEAVYGGYHQLLVYYYENHPLPNIPGLVDTVLSLQHKDGGFNPNGNGGACEDVDTVDILVNCYKRMDYRRSDIRNALRRCLRHILSTQNSDGGFPYNRDQSQSHMGIPGTEAEPNVSCTFPTWFRIHTLALIAEILPNEKALKGITFRFNKALSMGWHADPPGWNPLTVRYTLSDRFEITKFHVNKFRNHSTKIVRRVRRIISRILRKLRILR